MYYSIHPITYYAYLAMNHIRLFNVMNPIEIIANLLRTRRYSSTFVLTVFSISVNYPRSVQVQVLDLSKCCTSNMPVSTYQFLHLYLAVFKTLHIQWYGLQLWLPRYLHVCDSFAPRNTASSVLDFSIPFFLIRCNLSVVSELYPFELLFEI